MTDSYKPWMHSFAPLGLAELLGVTQDGDTLVVKVA